MGSSNVVVRKHHNTAEVAVFSPIVPRVNVRIRPGTMEDVAFIDRLQKAQTRAVRFLPTKAIEGKIARGEVLVAEAAEAVASCQLLVASSDGDAPAPATSNQPRATSNSRPVGYLIASDRYQKRDEIGYITQINVVPEFRRSLVAASLLQAQFDRSAYGCKLYCCWCAQDLVSANEFWEAMGFTAIAFRTGSCSRGQRSEVTGQKRPRIQKRIREGDEGAGATPWWYPSTTGGGEIREDRLVFPIPPGVSWRDVLPVVLAGEAPEARSQKPGAEVKRPRAKKVLKPPLKGSLWFKHEGVVEKVAPAKEETKLANRAIDPRLKKLARELRDRWTERSDLILPPPAKHDVRRMIADESDQNIIVPTALPMLDAA